MNKATKYDKQRLFEVMGRLDKTFISLNEAQAVSFTGGKVDSAANTYSYRFTIDDVDLICNIWHNNEAHDDDHYEVGFGIEGEEDNYRVGKDLRFLNTVLETVTNCVKDFVEKEPNVRIITFSGSADKDDRSEPWISTLRSKAYLRYVQNKFPEMDVNQDRFGTITIKVRDEVESEDNEIWNMKKVIMTVSDNAQIPERALQAHTNPELPDDWSIETDYGENSKKGGFLIEAIRDNGYFLRIELFDSGEEIEESFNTFDEMKNFILNYFK